MKTMKMIVAGTLACMCLTTVQAQEKSEAPKGKAIIQVFGNFHTGFGADNDDRGFELDRSYLGYQYELGKGISVKGVMDVGQSDDVNDYHRIAYIKNAQLTWKTGKWTLNGGLISTTQFNYQEKQWGYRYIMKSFQDLYKFGSSADLGLSAAYQFADWLSADAIIVNGEGYKKIQKTDGLAYGLGATVTPLKGLSIRLYAGVNEGREATQTDVWNYAAFVGYKGNGFHIGAEYNLIENYKNVRGQNLSGLSLYGSANLSKTIAAYARYDQLMSKDDWNKAKDEQALILGAQFKCGQYVKIAPNFRLTMPAADGADNHYSAYVSCYFGL